MLPCYFSVDVETAGPYPGRYPLLSIGACLVHDPGITFYAELRPERDEADPDALAVSGLSLERLAVDGEDPGEAVRRFAAWVDEVTPPGLSPVLVAFNAPFDWMFVADALHRHAGRNPFGHSALDLKALSMGADRVPWEATTFPLVASRHGLEGGLPHNALADARLQAELARRILAAIDPGDPT